MRLLNGKKALILGIANERSIAWGITQSFKEHGATIATTYLNEALKKRVEPLSEKVGAEMMLEMDVTKDDHFQNLHDTLKEKWGTVDIVVHSLAYANTQELKSRFHETSRSGFHEALDISAYSLVKLCHALRPLFNENSSVMAMTYHGSQQVLTNYNVMGVAKAALETSTRYLADDLGPEGVRVNCISAGPIKTLASSAISGLRQMLGEVKDRAPLRRNVDPADVGGMASYLGSDLSRGVTGQILYVDAGLSIMG